MARSRRPACLTAGHRGTSAGPSAILRAERPLLNLLQRACGIATLTRSYVDAVAARACRILHTRKTAPGLRVLDIAAVVAGGGGRHRVDLSHEVMVKDNHWQALVRGGGDLARALADARAKASRRSTSRWNRRAGGGGVSRPGDPGCWSTTRRRRQCGPGATSARRMRPGIEIEATGGITLENVRAYAEAGADFVSVGALTHSVRAADLAIEVRVG